MTPAAPLTVLLPVYDAAAHLREALDSVLGQSFADFELLAIDDGSRDGSRAILEACRDPRLRVVRFDANRGLTEALNEGLRLARGELVARQDADDVSEPRRLELQVAHLRAHPQTALVGAQGLRIDAAGRPAGALHRPCDATAIAWAFLFDNPFLHSAVVFRKAVVRELGGYDPEFRYCQDFELWSRLARRHAVANLREPLLRNRHHGRSMTGTMLDRNELENRAIIARNLEAAFGATPDGAQAERVAELRLGLRRERAAGFLAVFEDLLARFVALHPQARASRDFVLLVAAQYARVAMAVRYRDPVLLARLLARAGRGYPVIRETLRALREAARARAAGS